MRFALFLAVAIGCHAQSIQSLSAQIQKTPTPALYVERAAAYLASGDAKQAVVDIDRALDRDSLNVRALTLRGQANFKLGRYSETITDLSGAIALAPGDASLYVARSAAHAAAGDQPRAQADRNEALRLDPKSLAALDRQPAVAEVAAPAPVAPAPAPAPAPTVVAANTFVAPVPAPSAAKAPPAPVPSPAKIAATAPAVVAPAPAPPTAAKAPAPAPTKVATTAAAAPAAAGSGTADSRYQRAKEFLNQGKHAEAIAELDEAIKAQATNPILFNTRGYAYYLSKDPKRAIQDYDAALKLNPDYLNATHNRAIARKAAGDKAGSDADRLREVELGKKQGVKVP